MNVIATVCESRNECINVSLDEREAANITLSGFIFLDVEDTEVVVIEIDINGNNTETTTIGGGKIGDAYHNGKFYRVVDAAAEKEEAELALREEYLNDARTLQQSYLAAVLAGGSKVEAKKTSIAQEFATRKAKFLNDLSEL